MFFLSRSRPSNTDLPQHKPIPSTSPRLPHLYISKRFWTAARISILCSFIVIAALAWNCGSQLVPERLQTLQAQNVPWLSTVTDALTKNSSTPATHPQPSFEIEGFVKPLPSTPVVPAIQDTPKKEESSEPKFNILKERIDIVYTW